MQRVAALEDDNALTKELINGIDAAIYRTASGNPATFNDGYPANAKAISVALAPAQSGSGDPYPPGSVRNILDPFAFTATEDGLTYDAANDEFTLSAPRAIVYYGARTPLMVSGQGVRYTFSVTIHAIEDGADCRIAFRNSSNRILQGREISTPGRYSVSFTVPDDASYYISILATWEPASLGTVRYKHPQLEIGSAATDYVPYSNIRPISGATSVSVTRTGEGGANSQSVTVQLVDSNSSPLTVYGGTLDVATGTLSVTWGEYNPYNGETLPGRWISSMDAYAVGTAPTIGAQVVYELAAPVSYQLTPAQLAALSGYNSVSTDAQTLEIQYRVDPSLAYEELTNAILSLGAEI